MDRTEEYGSATETEVELSTSLQGFFVVVGMLFSVIGVLFVSLVFISEQPSDGVFLWSLGWSTFLIDS